MSLIPTPLTPYILWVKIAAVALVLTGAAYGGWHVRGWKCDAALKDEVAAQLKDRDAEIVDYKLELAKQEMFKDGQRAEYLQTRATLELRNRALEEKIRNANLNTVTARPNESLNPDEPFNREFLRDWNLAIQPVPAASVPGAGPDLSGADTTAARVTREDVLQNHRVIVDLYTDCKVKQDKVIGWDKKYRTQGATP